MIKNPNWKEADQLAIYKACRIWIRGHQSTPRTNPSSGRYEESNPGPPDWKSSALTTRPSVAWWWPSISFVHRAWPSFSFVHRSISFAYQTQKAWNSSLSTTEFWKNLLLCKSYLTKIWADIKFIYRQYAFVSVLAKSCPLPTLKFDKHATLFITYSCLFWQSDWPF